MRRAVAQVMEVCGAGSVVAGTYLLLGTGAALLVAGACLVAASVVIGR
jgi:hypothetical protein